MIHHVEIENYKSIRSIQMECKRINILIGKPNAGKSNILEALSLFGLEHSPENKFMEGFIRYNTLNQIFRNFDTRNNIRLIRDRYSQISITFPGTNNIFRVTLGNEDGIIFYVYREGNYQIKKREFPDFSDVKKYEFKSFSAPFVENPLNYLLPPHGENFYQVLESHLELREEMQKFLIPNGLELMLDVENKRASVLQRDMAALLNIPLYLIPDTFQRYIFHLAAIMSNWNSVLLFEEPESHSYAPYIYELAQQILNDQNGNQYFITTHNPYFLMPLLQETNNVAVFATWFEDYATQVRLLSTEEIQEATEYGVDFFLNLDHFIPVSK